MRIFLALALLATTPALAKAPPPDNPAIDYQAYASLVGELGPLREERRLAWAEFARHARAKGALLLDARSESAFARGHLEGAVNLPFTDFTAESLKAVIGHNPNRPIYCNNNFTNDLAPVRMKAAPLALNIQTFVNLHGYGYGYGNIWELADRIDFADPRYGWVAAGG